jgi:hypothetical protein
MSGPALSAAAISAIRASTISLGPKNGSITSQGHRWGEAPPWRVWIALTILGRVAADIGLVLAHSTDQVDQPPRLRRGHSNSLQGISQATVE